MSNKSTNFFATVDTSTKGTVGLYRIYRHGNPQDVFQGFWLSTDAAIAEVGPYHFDIRKLYPKGTDVPSLNTSADTKELLELIARAIDGGSIAVPQ